MYQRDASDIRRLIGKVPEIIHADINIYNAKIHLSRLIDAVLTGKRS